jgi:CRISPR-associated exonuclease Cas4
MSHLTEEDEITGGDLPPVMISALQHYAYCPRQCALIHVEQQFSDNIFTQRGNAVHRLVDEPDSTLEKGVRVERALPIHSRSCGLTGRADLVEWRGDTPYPVEYKHGPRKARHADELQLAAQALCLEEMTGHPVMEGALYHHKSRRRRVVPITPELRQEVRRIADAVRDLYRQKTLPPPVNDSRCDDCSLYNICQPRAVAERQRTDEALQRLFSPETDEETA